MPTDHQRGGTTGAAAIPDLPMIPYTTDAIPTSVNPNSPSPNSSSNTTFTTSHHSAPFSIHRHPLPVKLALSVENHRTRNNVLGDAVFPDWRDDATSADLGQPEEMQKKDPLGTQIWKLYSRTKSQLPNQERMENLTWRMMAMNLKRKEQERARFVAHSFALAPSAFTSPFTDNRLAQDEPADDKCAFWHRQVTAISGSHQQPRFGPHEPRRLYHSHLCCFSSWHHVAFSS